MNVLQCIMDKQFMGLRELYLQRNSITDYGFKKFVIYMKNIQTLYFPEIKRVGLENNLVTPEMREEMRPVPSFISY